MSSFESTGITSAVTSDYNHLLRHFLEKQCLPTHVLETGTDGDEIDGLDPLTPESSQSSGLETDCDSDESGTNLNNHNN